MEEKSSGLVLLVGAALAIAGGFQAWHLIANSSDFLGSQFGLQVAVKTQVQLLAVAFAAAVIGIALVTGKFIKEVMLISLVLVAILAVDQGLIKFNGKANTNSPENNTNTSAPAGTGTYGINADCTVSLTLYSQVTTSSRAKLIKCLKAAGYQHGKSLHAKNADEQTGFKWCEKKGVFNSKPTARRNCTTGFSGWRK